MKRRNQNQPQFGQNSGMPSQQQQQQQQQQRYNNNFNQQQASSQQQSSLLGQSQSELLFRQQQQQQQGINRPRNLVSIPTGFNSATVDLQQQPVDQQQQQQQQQHQHQQHPRGGMKRMYNQNSNNFLANQASNQQPHGALLPTPNQHNVNSSHVNQAGFQQSNFSSNQVQPQLSANASQDVSAATFPNAPNPQMQNQLQPQPPPPQQQQHHNTNMNTTLIVKKIPIDLNRLDKMQQHFSKFGQLVEIQCQYEQMPDTALIKFATNPQAFAAYKCPQPVFNNRFIRLYWFNSFQKQQQQQQVKYNY